MKLPNADRAVVDVNKLRDYCLNPSHPRGRHKARVFARKLGLTASDAEYLCSVLLFAGRTATNAVQGGRDDYGVRYVLDFPMVGPRGACHIRSHWIVRRGESFPRLTSCHVR